MDRDKDGDKPESLRVDVGGSHKPKGQKNTNIPDERGNVSGRDEVKVESVRVTLIESTGLVFDRTPSDEVSRDCDSSLVQSLFPRPGITGGNPKKVSFLEPDPQSLDPRSCCTDVSVRLREKDPEVYGKTFYYATCKTITPDHSET